MLLLSDHFGSSAIWFLLLGPNLIPTTLVFTCHQIFTYQYLAISVRVSLCRCYWLWSYGVMESFLGKNIVNVFWLHCLDKIDVMITLDCRDNQLKKVTILDITRYFASTLKYWVKYFLHHHQKILTRFLLKTYAVYTIQLVTTKDSKIFILLPPRINLVMGQLLLLFQSKFFNVFWRFFSYTWAVFSFTVNVVDDMLWLCSKLLPTRSIVINLFISRDLFHSLRSVCIIIITTKFD